jgi:hypothetical protein
VGGAILALRLHFTGQDLIYCNNQSFKVVHDVAQIRGGLMVIQGSKGGASKRTTNGGASCKAKGT